MPYRIVFDAYHLYHLPQFDPVINLMQKDDRFEVFLTTSSKNLPDEKDLTKRILHEHNVQCVLADNENQRAEKIRSLNPDFFICGWSRSVSYTHLTLPTIYSV